MEVSIEQPLLVFIDLFAGAGGTTTGIEHSKCFDKKIAKVIACVNHDAGAIASHAENHPECVHYTEDIRTLNVTALHALVRHARKLYPNAKICLWASLECTNFSKAKGGLARDADSRTLAEHLFRYVEPGYYDYIFIENVEEFMTWGPMRIKPKATFATHTELTIIKDKKKGYDKYGWEPLPERRGEDHTRWVNDMKAFGYNYDHRILNSADFGAHTSRRRYFAVFNRPELPVVWPEQTHAKKPTGDLKKWRAVKEVLDFTDEGQSIFTRKKPLSEATLERIYAGLIKYIANGDTSFIQKYYSGRPMGKVTSTDDPAGTLTTFNNQTLVQVEPICMLKYNSMDKNGKHTPPSLDMPSPVISTQGRLGLINANFLCHYYGNGFATSPEDPCPTVRTKDSAHLIQASWLDKQYGSGKHNHQSVEEPAGALTGTPKLNLVNTWLLSPHYDNKGNSVEEPAPTITANRKHHNLMFPQWGTQCSHSIDHPSPTLVARMDKMCPYLVQADGTGEPIAIAVFEDDSAATVKIKQFMAAYGLVDIKMRMLRINELKKITGFDESYVLHGTQADQKKFIGNAVPVLLAKAIIESFGAAIIKHINEQLRAA